MMTGRRSPVLFHSEHRQIPWLREIDPDPIVEIHPETARALGIEDGNWVWIEGRRGRAKRKAKLTPIVHRQMVMVPHGWWLPEKEGKDHLYGVWDININQLSRWDTGRSVLGVLQIHAQKIYKVQSAAERKNISMNRVRQEGPILIPRDGAPAFFSFESFIYRAHPE
jgi:anaerobic selenocysteine-containing dehydrogenase